MGTFIDETKKTGYETKVAEAKKLQDAVSQTVNGSGDYSGTCVSKSTSTCTNYFNYLRQEYSSKRNCVPRPIFRPPPLLDVASSGYQNYCDSYNQSVSLFDEQFLLQQQQVAEAKSHLPKVNQVIFYWSVKLIYTKNVKTALYYWKDWNQSIRTFLNEGIVTKNDSNLQDLNYDSGKNTKASSLKEYFTMLSAQNIYGPGCKLEAARAAEEMKDSVSREASTEIEDILEICLSNRKNARTVIESLKITVASIESLIALGNSTKTHLENF